MSKNIKTHSEVAFQERLVAKLVENIWEAPDHLNGNIAKVTVDDLIENWRKELNRINADVLEGVPLTDNEFSQVISKVNSIDNSYEAAKILSMESSTGKIDGIYRDYHQNVSREIITLKIFVKAAVSGGISRYSVAREVVSSNGNRFDIVLLINGLPLINIEQKRADKTLDDAFGQFKRYYRDGEYVNNFMVFSQMMVIMSEVATRYFATPKNIRSFNPAFVFHWTDEHNNPINDWETIAETFLRIPMVHQLVGDYLIIDEAIDEENRKHMIMRPYQVYALRSILFASGGQDNPDRKPHGGFVWHTTGSGKTITSFKTALFLATRTNADKVVFLVDRRELDSKTSEQFKAYSAYESVSVDDTEYTHHLRKELFSPKSGIIVTTTFKLNALVKDLIENNNNTLSNKKIIFIIDEAHRTTMGNMMGVIKEYFNRHGLFYGFTGTPLFEENKITGKINRKSELIDTTEKLFGPSLHEYTIDRAIEDGNVLGFHIDYINTGEFENHDSLREEIIKQESLLNPEKTIREIERNIHKLSKAKVEEKASELDILKYHDDTHIPRVVEEILKNWETQSKNRKFNAILTAAYKERVIAFYHEFKRQMKESDKTINVAMTFSVGNENDPEDISVEILEEMFEDYGKITGLYFNHEDSTRAANDYFEDLTTRATRGGSGRYETNLDLIIVADQLLTGYDSKYLNTLYVDRNLQLQSLIQAYSRTNRIYGSDKEFGTIINFKYPEITREKVNEALRLYGSGGTSSKVIVEHYDVAVNKFKAANKKMIESLEDPTQWADIQSDEEKKQVFITCFKDSRDKLNSVTQYYEYQWNDNTFGIDEHTWLQYTGAYINIRRDEEDFNDETPPNPLVGRTKLSGTQVIDASHIIKLIGERMKPKQGFQTVDSETLRIIYEQIQELSNMGDDEQAKLLKEFVEEELKPGKISSSDNFDTAFNKWKESKINYNFIEFSKEWGIAEESLEKSFEYYSFNEKDSIPFYDEILKDIDDDVVDEKFNSRIKYFNELRKELSTLFTTTKRKYK